MVQNDFDEEHPAFGEYDDFCRSHFPICGFGGGAFPDVGFLPDGEIVIVSVENIDSSDTDFQFTVSTLNAQIPMDEVLSPIYHFTRWIEKRLLASENSIAQAEGRGFADWLRYVESEDSRKNVLGGLIGFGVSQLARIERLISDRMQVSAFFPQELLCKSPATLVTGSAPLMLLRSSSPVLKEDDAAEILVQVLSKGRHIEGEKRIREFYPMLQLRIIPEKDYEDGYQAASLVRRQIGNISGFMDVEELINSLGIPIYHVSMGDFEIDGAAFWDDNTGPLMLINPESRKASTSWGKRMTLGHELGHLLLDKGEFRPLGVFSGPWASPGLERRANAFAAELLVPREGLMEFFETRKWVFSDECIQELSDRFGVGHTMIFNHLNNRLKDSILFPSI